MIKKMSIVAVAAVMCGGGFVWAADAQSVLTDIHQTNLKEIHMGRLAAEKGQSAEVKSYGETLVKDHTDADKKVEALAQKQGIALEAPGMLKKKMNEHDMSSMKDKTGADFDKAFAKAMVSGHQKTITELEDAQKTLGGTPTGDLIAELLPTLRQHLATAQKIQAEQTPS